MRRIRSDSCGLTIVELIVGVALVLVVLLCAGSVYLSAERSFRDGSQKLLAQREASLLSTVISRRARVANQYAIYVVPNRTVLADSGNGIAFLNKTGAVQWRLEWDATQQTLIDSAGARVSSMKLQGVGFTRHLVDPTILHYRFKTDDERGNLVDIESAASARN
jgi:Tfp pilus assembly protein PilE